MENLKTISVGMLFGLAATILIMLNWGTLTFDELVKGWGSLYESETGSALTALFFFFILFLVYKVMKKIMIRDITKPLKKRLNKVKY